MLPPPRRRRRSSDRPGSDARDSRWQRARATCAVVLALLVGASGCDDTRSDADARPPFDAGLVLDATGDGPGLALDGDGPADARPLDAYVAPSPDEMFLPRVRELIRQMTLDEKVAQLQNAAPAIPRLGIPAYDYWNESLHGVARNGLATVFPQVIGMSASFDATLVHEVAVAISDEARAKFHDTLRRVGSTRYFEGLTFFAPNVNLLRDPRWARGHETFGEDPVLTATLATEYVRGLQGDDPVFLKTIATAKHFAVHSGPEATRHGFDAVVTPRDLAESYLPQFEELARDANVYSFMAAYNRVNGEACSASPTLLQHTLREAWGFRGYVVSDCYGIEDLHHAHMLAPTAQAAAALALRAGTDLECGAVYGSLPVAIAEGLATEADVDRALERVLLSRFRLGLFEPAGAVAYADIDMTVVDSPAHRDLALQASRESLVLLQNDGTLPLDTRLPLRVAVVGPTADDRDVLLGSYHGDPSSTTTVLDGIRMLAPSGSTIVHVPGCDVVGTDVSGIAAAQDAAVSADVVVAVLGLTPRYENEPEKVGPPAGDRTTLDLPGVQQLLLEQVATAGKPLILVLTGSSFGVTWAAVHANAIVASFYPGQDGGRAVGELLFGAFSPSGRLPMTYYASADDLPAFDDYRMQSRTYRFFSGTPLFEFGSGLGYTTFRFEMLGAPATSAVADPLSFDVRVTNTGARRSGVPVQVYLERATPSPQGPRRWLAAFSRVELDPSASTVVHFALPPRRLARVDASGRRLVEPTELVVSAGDGQPGAGGAYPSPARGASARVTLTGAVLELPR